MVDNSFQIQLDNELLQNGNENRNAALWLQPEGMVYKQYIDYNDTAIKNHHVLIKISANKKLSNLPEITMPLHIVTEGNRICGYLMEYHEGKSLSDIVDSTDISSEYKLSCFIKLARVINNLPRDIFIGDLHSGNVIVLPDGDIRLIDIDGFSIKGCEITCPLYSYGANRDVFGLPKYLHRDGTPKVSRESDIFCFFVLMLEWIMDVGCVLAYTKQELFRYFEFLKDEGFEPKILRMIYRLFNPQKNRLNPKSLKKLDVSEIGKYSYAAFCEKTQPQQ